jgi:hypothetical protein
MALAGARVPLASAASGGVGRPNRPFLIANSASLARGCPSVRPLGRGASARMAAIWSILPVVICLSQRLSHASLSISNLYCETANGSLNQLSFI